MVQLLSIDQDSNLCLTKDAWCLITWHQHLLGKSWTPSIGPRLHSTILASGMWDFKVSNNNINSGIRFAFLCLTSISGISSVNHRRHLWLSGTSHRQRFNIRPLTISQYHLGNPWVFCKLPRHRNTLGFYQMPKFFCCVGALPAPISVLVESNNDSWHCNIMKLCNMSDTINKMLITQHSLNNKKNTICCHCLSSSTREN